MFCKRLTHGGRSVLNPPYRSVPHWARASQKKKNERVARNERKPMMPNFKVQGHLLPSQVRSMTQELGKSEPARTS